MRINNKDITISKVGDEASKVGVIAGAYFATKAVSKILDKATDSTIRGLGANPNTPLIKAVKPIGLIVAGSAMSYAMSDKYAKAAGTGIAFAGMEEGYNLAMGVKNQLLQEDAVAGFGSNIETTAIPSLNLPDLDGYSDEYSDMPALEGSEDEAEYYAEEDLDNELEAEEDYYNDFVEL